MKLTSVDSRCALVALALASSLATSIPAHAQILHPSGPLPSFEVATVKPWRRAPSPPPQASDGGAAPKKVAKIAPGSPGGQTTDRVHTILPTTILIEQAYNLPVGSKRVVGGPDWTRQDVDQFEIQAKIEDSLFAAMQKMTAPQQREQVDLMEQSLLAERFKLKVHFETRELPIYTLVVAKGGAKLTPASPGETSSLTDLDTVQGSEMVGKAVTLDQFVHAPFLRTGGRPVVDQTGLTGAYDFTLKSGPDSFSPPGTGQEMEADEPPFFKAIQEQLGLQLVPAKDAIEVIVIDHIEKPSEN